MTTPERLAAHGVIEVVGDTAEPERSVPLEAGSMPCEIGRAASGIPCPEDEHMAAIHARLVCEEDRVMLDGSVGEEVSGPSGVWLRLRGPDGRSVGEGAQLWLGSQVLLVKRLPEAGWQLQHYGADGRLRARVPVPAKGLMIGRTSELVLDPEDGQLSRRHAQVTIDEGRLRFYDRGSHNGSFLRLTEPEVLEDGDEFRVGSTRFRYVAPLTPAEPAPAEPAPAEPRPAEPVPEEDDPGTSEEATLVVPFPDADVPEVEPRRPSAALEGESTGSAPAPMGERESLGARLRRIGRRLAESEQSEAPAPAGVDVQGEVGSAAAVDAGSSREAATVIAAIRDRETEDSSAGPGPAAGPVSPNAEEAAEGETVVIVIDSEAGSVSIDAKPGSTILEAARAAGVERGSQVDWECEDGGCGVCILGVVEGADRMDPPDPATGEMKTIQITEQVAPDPGRYRLACLAKVRGAVRLRKMT